MELVRSPGHRKPTPVHQWTAITKAYESEALRRDTGSRSVPRTGLRDDAGSCRIPPSLHREVRYSTRRSSNLCQAGGWQLQHAPLKHPDAQTDWFKIGVRGWHRQPQYLRVIHPSLLCRTSHLPPVIHVSLMPPITRHYVAARVRLASIEFSPVREQVNEH